jgi:hypothetical protein
MSKKYNSELYIYCAPPPKKKKNKDKIYTLFVFKNENALCVCGEYSTIKGKNEILPYHG